jgi:hypothetical protein
VTDDLSVLITPEPDPRSRGRSHLTVADGWQTGRGAWGGLVVGATVRALAAVEPEPQRRLRSLTAELVGPVPPGRHELRTEVLRRGSATTTVAARLLGPDAGPDGGPSPDSPPGNVLAHAVGVLGARRSTQGAADGPGWLTIDPPAELARGWQAVPVLEIGPPVAPRFSRHLEYRPIAGIPYSGATEGTALGWVRPRDPVAVVDDALVAALADAWWLSLLVRIDGVRPVGTLAFTFDLVGEPAALPRDDDGRMLPLLHRGRVLAAHDGYAVETRELWTADGDLLGLNTQTAAVIR